LAEEKPSDRRPTGPEILLREWLRKPPQKGRTRSALQRAESDFRL